MFSSLKHFVRAYQPSLRSRFIGGLLFVLGSFNLLLGGAHFYGMRHLQQDGLEITASITDMERPSSGRGQYRVYYEFVAPPSNRMVETAKSLNDIVETFDRLTDEDWEKLQQQNPEIKRPERMAVEDEYLYQDRTRISRANYSKLAQSSHVAVTYSPSNPQISSTDLSFGLIHAARTILFSLTIAFIGFVLLRPPGRGGTRT